MHILLILISMYKNYRFNKLTLLIKIIYFIFYAYFININKPA